MGIRKKRKRKFTTGQVYLIPQDLDFILSGTWS